MPLLFKADFRKMTLQLRLLRKEQVDRYISPANCSYDFDAGGSASVNNPSLLQGLAKLCFFLVVTCVILALGKSVRQMILVV